MVYVTGLSANAVWFHAVQRERGGGGVPCCSLSSVDKSGAGKAPRGAHLVPVSRFLSAKERERGGGGETSIGSRLPTRSGPGAAPNLSPDAKMHTQEGGRFAAGRAGLSLSLTCRFRDSFRRFMWIGLS